MNQYFNNITNGVWAQHIARTLSPQQCLQVLNQAPTQALQALLYYWPLWCHAYQRPPSVPYTTWLLLGGRGSGKTRAGAQWCLQKLTQGYGRMALVGNTLDDVIDVMVQGPSGVMAHAPPWQQGHFCKTQRRLSFGNGAQLLFFSAQDPDRLRGHQFDAAWCDELAKWHYPDRTWDMLQFALRIGQQPQQMVTTTPRPLALLRHLLSDPHTVVTRASTYSNRQNLSPAFFNTVVARYQNTTLGRQELDGVLLEDASGALWQRAAMDAQRVTAAPALERVVVAIDPPVSSHSGSDHCGIVVAGMVGDAHADTAHYYVLADCSVQGQSPAQWAAHAAAVYRQYRADRLVAEANQGGDMVQAVIRAADATIAYRAVYARRGKVLRAEPIAALYERGLVHHVGLLPQLEDQMCVFSYQGLQHWGMRHTRSPDRVDALVWALTDLLYGSHATPPRIRVLCD